MFPKLPQTVTWHPHHFSCITGGNIRKYYLYYWRCCYAVNNTTHASEIKPCTLILYIIVLTHLISNITWLLMFVLQVFQTCNQAIATLPHETFAMSLSNRRNHSKNNLFVIFMKNCDWMWILYVNPRTNQLTRARFNRSFYRNLCLFRQLRLTRHFSRDRNRQ